MHPTWTFVAKWPIELLLVLPFRALAPLFRSVRDAGGYPWLIGGHRGRLRADNAAALHGAMLRAGQPCAWIATSPALAAELRAKGIPVLRRDSFAARLALLRAPVLLYSHGEDDLDLFLRLFRRCLGLRVYLNHSQNHLKAGQFLRPEVEAMSPRQRRAFAREMTDFDILLASSPAEKRNFDRSFREGLDRILPRGGGAHVDDILELARAPVGNRLVWFPTFREHAPEQAALEAMIARVTDDRRLHAWLEREDLHLSIVRHINSGSSRSTTDHPRLSFHGPDEIQPLLAQAPLFVSDYSGLVIDWLCFGRPILHFPFDEAEYLRTRRFYNSLDDLHYGPLVRSADAFVETLVTGAWRNLAPWADRRAKWLAELFPDLRPGYAERCLETVRDLRARFDETTRTFRSPA